MTKLKLTHISLILQANVKTDPLDLKIGTGDGTGTKRLNIKNKIENDAFLINYSC